jgi:hypothetical protein
VHGRQRFPYRIYSPPGLRYLAARGIIPAAPTPALVRVLILEIPLMRSATTPQSRSPLHRLGYVTTSAAGDSELDAWRQRALRQATTVRRVLRSAGVMGTSTSSTVPTLDALQAGTVEELLLTPRFIEMNPEVSATALRLARDGHAQVSTVTGAAAFELDLVAGGIGAMLRRSASRRPATTSAA